VGEPKDETYSPLEWNGMGGEIKPTLLFEIWHRLLLLTYCLEDKVALMADGITFNIQRNKTTFTNLFYNRVKLERDE
jgi:hypothetical protein